ncbi:DUF6634 family protein [Aureimonas jatrophae]|uniref:Uncharacterized protein n=1 Tax=Aureimonas jatrophae TaxID=1166073 RepID=A0A1H0M5I1_9HYPH|nr:DUF6634 family protein [Aureimonas jatrophae]MBB3952614.1 hypothetical protein [Aureimonas jatrophae]SDO75709.1 hypothetical protein SAMN05192530_11278 [Aureimonas jatrophae]
MTAPPGYLVPGLPVGSEGEDVLRLTRLVADLARYAGGTPPSVAELTDAPSIDDWAFVEDPSALRLSGRISGHPLIRGPTAVTSRIHGLDPNLRWVRTYSRLWRLGERR